jgi:hypothetical protein
MADGWRQNAAYTQDVVITSGQQNSAAADLKEKTLVGVSLPATLTGTSLTFFAAAALAGTYKQVTNEDGSAYSVTVAADKWCAVDANKFLGVRFLKVRSGSAEGADRTIALVVRPL